MFGGFIKRLAFVLYVDFEGRRYYIHKDYGLSDNSPNTTINQNFALLFALESDARRWALKKDIPDEYEPLFVPVSIPVEPKSYEKIYYKRVRDLRGKLEEDLPEFLK